MDVNQRKVGVILSYLSIVVLTLITLVYTPIVLRYLGKSEYGVYDLTVSLVSYLSLLSLGFGGAYVKFYYQYKVKDQHTNISKLNGLFMIVYMLMGFTSLLVGSVIIKYLEVILNGKMTIEEILLSKKLMKILIINIFLTFPMTVFESYITANEKFIFQRLLVLFRQILNPLISIPLLALGYRSIGLVVTTTIFTLISLLLNIYYSVYKLNMKFIFKDLDVNLLKEIAIFSSFLFLNMITDQLNWSIDKFVLGKYVGTLSITIYSMGYLINTMYLKMSLAISTVFIPKVNNMVQNKATNKEITDFFTKIGRLQYYIVMLILLGFITFGFYFITEIWLDKTYYESYFVALLLIIPVTIASIQNIGLEIQRAMNMHKFSSIVYFCIAIFNLIISIPLAKKFGPIGSALGTNLGIILGHGLVMNVYYNNKIGIDILYFWKNIISITKGLIIPILLTLIIRKVGIESTPQFICLVVLYTIIYCISIYKFSMNSYEKKLFSGPIKFIFKR